MDNCEVKTFSASSDVKAVVPAADSTDDQSDQNEVYIAVIAKKLGTTENGIIQLKILTVWNYFPLSSTDNAQNTQHRKFYMYHTKTDSTPVQLGICGKGPFGPAPIGCDEKIFLFTGPDTDCTISHINKKEYLGSHEEGEEVEIYESDNPDEDSYFSIWIRHDGVSRSNGAICVIFLAKQPRLALWYYDSKNVVETRPFNNSDPGFQFVLKPVNLPAVKFVNDHECK